MRVQNFIWKALEGRNHMGDLVVYGRIILKQISVYQAGLGQDHEAGLCQHGNKLEAVT
jgi:hypothetical protein